MAQRDEIVEFLDELLDSPGFPDYGPNGLQVPGASRSTSVVTGVSATRELFEACIRRKTLRWCLCTTGFSGGDAGALSRDAGRAAAALLANDLNLVAYHLPLDAHPSVGNNALL